MKASPYACRVTSHELLIANVEELAAQAGLSINRLADAAGISRSYLSAVMRGQKIPTMRTLDKLALALSVTPAYLVAGRDGRTWSPPAPSDQRLRDGRSSDAD